MYRPLHPKIVTVFLRRSVCARGVNKIRCREVQLDLSRWFDFWRSVGCDKDPAPSSERTKCMSALNRVAALGKGRRVGPSLSFGYSLSSFSKILGSVPSFCSHCCAPSWPAGQPWVPPWPANYTCDSLTPHEASSKIFDIFAMSRTSRATCPT